MLSPYDEARNSKLLHRRVVRLTQAHDSEKLPSLVLNDDKGTGQDHAFTNPSTTHSHQLIAIPRHDSGETQALLLVHVGANEMLGRPVMPR